MNDDWYSFERRGGTVHVGHDWDLIVYGDGSRVWLDDGLPLDAPDRELMEKIPEAFVEQLGLKEEIENELGTIWSRPVETEVDVPQAEDREKPAERETQQNPGVDKETEEDAQPVVQQPVSWSFSVNSYDTWQGAPATDVSGDASDGPGKADKQRSDDYDPSV